MSQEEKLEFEMLFRSLLTHDWNAHLALPWTEQVKFWNVFTDRFGNRLDRLEKTGSEHDFDDLLAMLRKCWDGLFEIRTKLGVRRIYSLGYQKYLHDRINEKRISNIHLRMGNGGNPCACALRAQFRLVPEESRLRNLGEHFDGYFLFEIFSCDTCGFHWESSNLEDDTGGKSWEKWHQALHPINRTS